MLIILFRVLVESTNNYFAKPANLAREDYSKAGIKTLQSLNRGHEEW